MNFLEFLAFFTAVKLIKLAFINNEKERNLTWEEIFKCLIIEIIFISLIWSLLCYSLPSLMNLVKTNF